MLTVICQLADHMLGHCIQQGLRGTKQGLPLGQQLCIRPNLHCTQNAIADTQRLQNTHETPQWNTTYRCFPSFSSCMLFRGRIMVGFSCTHSFSTTWHLQEIAMVCAIAPGQTRQENRARSDKRNMTGTDHVGQLLRAEAVQLQQCLLSNCQQQHGSWLMPQHRIPAPQQIPLRFASSLQQCLSAAN